MFEQRMVAICLLVTRHLSAWNDHTEGEEVKGHFHCESSNKGVGNESVSR